VTEPSLDRIIEQLQFCIIDARALQLAMLETPAFNRVAGSD
jgi:hypothetical protein